MNKVTVICLTKAYNKEDFEHWYNYHCNIGCNVVIYDNESTIDIKQIVRHNYNYIVGWPDKYKLFDTILNENKLGINDDDYIIFLDDDEYLWYNRLSYSSLYDAITSHFKELDTLLLPGILMSTKHIITKRNKNLVSECYYRRADLQLQGEAIIKYKFGNKYKFDHGSQEKGHVPKINNIRMSNVVSTFGTIVTKTTFGPVDYNADLRLYHYDVKSQEDWLIKIDRGSPWNKHAKYDTNLKNYKYFGDYNIPDFAVQNVN